MIYDFGDIEALRLMRAFNQIDDPKTRRLIIAIVEARAGRDDATIKVSIPEQKSLGKNAPPNPKPSLDEPRRIVEEYAADLREYIKRLRKHLQ